MKLKQDISIGPNLKKYRELAGLTQEAVAARLQVQGIDILREIISQMERGKCNVRISALLAMSELYGVPIQSFFTNLDQAQ
ncbi:MAG: helix-turn-helix domain-containing protein [Oscillospiraceae bacterium]|nr:helix-turn-helix domain-containing protein [Oscillospiraceae bacterium]